MRKRSISTRWFPSCAFSAKTDHLLDNLFTDFDQQAEQLAGHDQTYLQLSRGAFQGRFLSAFLGPKVAVHLEYCNQALEQEVAGSPDLLTFGVVLSDTTQFRVNGTTLSRDSVFVLPPNGALHVLSPTDGAIMAITIHRETFLHQAALAPAAADWLAQLSSTIGTLHAPRLAQRFREDAMTALESVAQSSTPLPRAMIGQALSTSLASKVSLEWNSTLAREMNDANASFDRYRQCQKLLDAANLPVEDTLRLGQSVGASKRAVENAFSKVVSMGPLTYSRVLRLHAARRKLSDPTYANLSIGDIAADHGFWDWSRFSHTYGQHFGERPSETRQALSARN